MEIRRDTWRIIVIVLFAFAAGGCARSQEDQAQGLVADEVYVQVMTELLLLDANPPEGGTEEERAARADSARQEILGAHEVTASEVLDLAESLGGEAGRMESLWEQITHRYDSARVADLARDTEARTEADGKLGAAARTAATPSSPPAAADSVGTSADSRQRPRPRNRDIGSRTRRPERGEPTAADTAGQPD